MHYVWVSQRNPFAYSGQDANCCRPYLSWYCKKRHLLPVCLRKPQSPRSVCVDSSCPYVIKLTDNPFNPAYGCIFELNFEVQFEVQPSVICYGVWMLQTMTKSGINVDCVAKFSSEYCHVCCFWLHSFTGSTILPHW